jgi:transporter family protein
MPQWIWYAIGAAVFYALHQVFTKLAAPHIHEALGALVVETTAAVTIALYLAVSFGSEALSQKAEPAGLLHSALTGVCVGVGTILFFILFQRGAPLTALPAVLALGAALLGLVGIVLFGEAATVPRLLGIVLSVVALYLLRSPAVP